MKKRSFRERWDEESRIRMESAVVIFGCIFVVVVTLPFMLYDLFKEHQKKRVPPPPNYAPLDFKPQFPHSPEIMALRDLEGLLRSAVDNDFSFDLYGYPRVSFIEARDVLVPNMVKRALNELECFDVPAQDKDLLAEALEHFHDRRIFWSTHKTNTEKQAQS